jgi:ubiquitin-like protein Pup
MAQIKQAEKTPSESEERAGPAPSRSLADTATRLGDALDELIEEIDDVLEENAEEFVKGYVQEGGE